MKTNFSPEQLQNPAVRSSENILRKCVHCGFCTATCPTYMLLGDELDSPRGRIHQIQAMLESKEAPAAETVKHLDRCLSCYSCMSTCPSGVNYMHLLDHARQHIETKFRRPVMERALRAFLLTVLTRPTLLRIGLSMARIVAPLAKALPRRLRAILNAVPATPALRTPIGRPGIYPAQGERKMRVALLTGCVQSVVAPNINAAAISVLTRHGVEVVVVEGVGCCGALPLHLGKSASAVNLAKVNVSAWSQEIDRAGLDAIVVTTSGCGTVIKDYEFLLRDQSDVALDALEISRKAKDISEILAELSLGQAANPHVPGLRVGYHSACSLRHGQRVEPLPRTVLERLGFDVAEPHEKHICCGSAGTYSFLQPDLSERLQQRKARNLEQLAPAVIASGNIGCITQVASATTVPVVHLVELVDWATGGAVPSAMKAPT